MFLMEIAALNPDRDLVEEKDPIHTSRIMAKLVESREQVFYQRIKN